MKTVADSLNQVEKVPSGIQGFDDISKGGIPKGRTTLVSGTSGSGKTVFAAQFLYNGIVERNENGVFVTFEETPADIMRNMASFGWDLPKLTEERKWIFVDASPDEVEEITVGTYDLGAFMARIEYAANKVNAKRVAIDSVSALFPRFENATIIRRELYRIASKLKQMGVTSLMTAERPTEEGAISRFGVEEFVSDNVILLHNRLTQRGFRDRSVEILKFRGSTHETSEAPLIVTEEGMNVFPRPKPELRGKGFSEKMRTGIHRLDEMFHGGIYKNSTTLISGASGTGKTVSVLHFILEGAKEGERCLFIEFEESPQQLYRNAESFGWDLRGHVEKGIVHLVCHYPEDLKAEQYLKTIRDLVMQTRAKRVALDSLSALQRIYEPSKFREFVVGLNAFLKMHDCTSLLTNTTSELLGITQITEAHLSTATDNIILLKYVELGGMMRRLLTILKARGSDHVKELVEFEINKDGMRIVGPFKGVDNLLSGIAVTKPPLDVTEYLSSQMMEKMDQLRKEFAGYVEDREKHDNEIERLRSEIEGLQKESP